MGKISLRSRFEAEFKASLDATVDLVISYDLPVIVSYDTLTISFYCYDGHKRIFEWANIPDELHLSITQVDKFANLAVIRLFDNGIPVNWVSEYRASDLYTIVIDRLEETGHSGDDEYFINAKDETEAILTMLKYGASLGHEPKRSRK